MFLSLVLRPFMVNGVWFLCHRAALLDQHLWNKRYLFTNIVAVWCICTPLKGRLPVIRIELSFWPGALCAPEDPHTLSLAQEDPPCTPPAANLFVGGKNWISKEGMGKWSECTISLILFIQYKNYCEINGLIKNSHQRYIIMIIKFYYFLVIRS